MFKFIFLLIFFIFKFIQGDTHQITVTQIDSILNNSELVIEEPVKDTVWEFQFNTVASWYGSNGVKDGSVKITDRFHGKKTHSGEIFDTNELTCAVKRKLWANKTFRFGDILKVTNLSNGNEVKVRVNDTGSLTKTSNIDLSYEAMRLLEGVHVGRIKVKVEKMKIE